MERDVILLAGSPGSGKSTLGKNLVHELRPNITVEHLSTGDLVRLIGRGALRSAYTADVQNHLNSSRASEPLQNNILFGITSEALKRVKQTELMLLDGYPRNRQQVDDVSLLALEDERTLLGMIVTHINFEQAIFRLLKRRSRLFEDQLIESTARARLMSYNQSLLDVVKEADRIRLPVEFIETSGEKYATTQLGMTAVSYFLSTGHPSS